MIEQSAGEMQRPKPTGDELLEFEDVHATGMPTNRPQNGLIRRETLRKLHESSALQSSYAY